MRVVAFGAFAVLFSVLPAFSAHYLWTGGGEAGNWSDAANWSDNAGEAVTAVPGAGDIAEFASTVEIASAIELGEGTLTITNAASTKLHFKATISGKGGIFKGGDGELHLHASNTFEGGIVSCGTGDYDKDTSKTASSCVYVYADGALGKGSAQMDPVEIVGGKGHGALLYISGKQQKNITISCPVTVSGNYGNIGNISITDGCTSITFKELVTCPGRITFRSGSGVTWTLEKGYSCSGYNIFEGGEFHFKGPVKGNGTFHAYNGVKTHLYSQENGYVYCVVGGGIELHGENVLRPSGSYYSFSSKNSVVNLNGCDQTLTGMGKPFQQGGDVTVCTFGFTSPAGSPAILHLTSSVPAQGHFRGLFSGTAGLEWAPEDPSKEFVFSNTVQTTVGEFIVSSGTMRFKSGAGVDGLGRLTVREGAKLKVEPTSGVFHAREIFVEQGGTLELDEGVVVSCGSLTVGETRYDDFVSFDKESLPGVVSGGGVLRRIAMSNKWIGGSGEWSDGRNWSLGSAPAGGENVVIDSDKTIVISSPTAKMGILDISGGATVVFSNGYGNCLWADEMNIRRAVLTAAGPFTNAADKCRVFLKCRNLEMTSESLVDLDGKGWRGGGYVQKDAEGANTNPNIPIVNEAGVASGGFGPGGAYNAQGASHFGYGAGLLQQDRVYSKSVSKLYDDPYAPIEPGSGGCGFSGSAYSCAYDNLSIPNGGGAVYIEASGSVRIDGRISACGVGAYINHWYYCQNPKFTSSAGSGGSVWIRCSSISGTGEILADGGNGGYSIPLFLSAIGGKESRGAAGGGGGIAIVYDSALQKAGAVVGMKISAAAGYYPPMPKTSDADSKTEVLPYAKMDKYRRDAEPGTLFFTDTKIVDDTIGKSLNGKLFALENYAYQGNLEWSYGNVRFGATGAVFAVSGNLTVTGEWSRIDLGGITKTTNFGTRPYISSGTVPVAMKVGGDLVVSNGAALAVYAAAVPDETSPGAKVEIDGAFEIGDGGTVLPTSDYGYGGAPVFAAASFVLAENGKVDADHRGYSGAWMSLDYTDSGAQGGRDTGCGPGGGRLGGAGGGHGGAGGIGEWEGKKQSDKAGRPYGDRYLPVRSGSGGGSNGYTWAGDGGGVFHLVASGTVELAGSISANGSYAEYMVPGTAHWGGSGSGGSVCIRGATVTALPTARISARGGDALMLLASDVSSGTGGGGRIAIWAGYDVELAMDKPRRVHSADPSSPVLEGGIDWAGIVDVGAGTNIILDVTKNLTPLESCYGEPGSVYFNRSLPQGLQLLVR